MSHSPENIRCIGIVAHPDAGKTTVTERMMLITSVLAQPGRTANSEEDKRFIREAMEKGVAITSAYLSCTWHDTYLNVIDTPASTGFSAELDRSLRVSDGLVLVISGVQGVEPMIAAIWNRSSAQHLPRLAFVNKLDQPQADFWAVVDQLRTTLDANAVPYTIPLFNESGEFYAILDLVYMKAFKVNDFARIEIPVPPLLTDFAVRKRQELLDDLAQFDERIVSCLDSGETVPIDLIESVTRKAVLSNQLLPVFAGAASVALGIRRLMDGIVDYLPSPSDRGAIPAASETGDSGERIQPTADAPFAGLVFKSIEDNSQSPLTFVRVFSGTLKSEARILNSTLRLSESAGAIFQVTMTDRMKIDEAGPGSVVALSGPRKSQPGHTLCTESRPVLIEPRSVPAPTVEALFRPTSSWPMDALHGALTCLSSEDPMISVFRPMGLLEVLVTACSEAAMSTIPTRIEALSPNRGPAPEPEVRARYRETPVEPADSTFTLRREHDLHGEFACVQLRVEPNPNSPFEFQIQMDDPASQVPPEFHAAVQQGVEDALAQGPVSGSQVFGVLVTLTGGAARPVLSSSEAFRKAAAQAFRQAFAASHPVILEPWVHMEIALPDTHLEATRNRLRDRRANIVSERRFRKGSMKIEAIMPVAESLGLADELKAVVGNNLNCSMAYHAHTPLPVELHDWLVSAWEARNR